MLFWWGGSIPTYSLRYTLPTMVQNLGYTAVKAQALAGVSYFAIFLAAASYASQAPIIGAWASVNVLNPSKRATAIGLLSCSGRWAASRSVRLCWVLWSRRRSTGGS